MKKTALLIGILLILGCSQAVEKGHKGSIDWITDLSAAKTMAKSEGKPMLIDFYADWCSWCRRMDTDTYGNLKVAELAKNSYALKLIRISSLMWRKITRSEDCP